MHSNSPFQNKHIFIFLTLALGLRLGFFFIVAPWKPENAHYRLHSNDTKEYEDMAEGILDGSELSIGSPYTTNIRRTPAYPLLLATVYGIFGKKRFVVILIQIVFGVWSCYLAYLIGARLLDEKIGILTGYLLALDYLSIIFCMTILTEILFTFLLLAGILFWIRFLDKERNRDIQTADRSSKFAAGGLAGAGIILGVGALCKPLMLYFFPLLLLVYLFNGFRVQGGIKKRLKNAIVGILFFFLPMSPWLARNTAIFGTPIFTSIKGYNLLLYNAAYMKQSLVGYELLWVRVRLEREVKKRLGKGKTTVVQKAEMMQQVALEEIRSHPFTYLKTHLIGMLPTLFGHGKNTLFQLLGRKDGWVGEKHHLASLSEFWNQELWVSLKKIISVDNPWLKAAFLGITGILFVFICGISYGAYILWQKREKPENRLLGVVIGYFWIISSPVGSVRFKLILMPFLLMLFAVAGKKVLQNFKKSQSVELEGM